MAEKGVGVEIVERKYVPFLLNVDVNRKNEDGTGFREIYIFFNMTHIQKDILIIYAQLIELSE